MRGVPDQWWARSLILLVLAFAYYWLVVQVIGWMAALVKPGYQGLPMWLMFVRMHFEHLAAVLVASLPICVAMLLFVRRRRLLSAIVITLPVAAQFVFDVIWAYPTDLMGAKTFEQTMMDWLALVNLVGIPVLATALLSRVLPVPAPSESV
ncbi:hypothetical protein [uncultured Abyssibacter sp.]|uniref:hypothetical protein n=1 Tax=uncultured Abyssibacter sp. TaxID=2320202 RepID=UPI0032B20B3D